MNQEKIGSFIQELRKEKGLSQLELAERIGVTDRAVSKWENGRGLPDLSLMKPLCDELGITINELLSGERIREDEYQEKLEENIINTINYQHFNTLKLFLYYIIVFFTGIIIVPTLVIVSPVFILTGVQLPVMGLIKLLGHIIGFNTSYVTFQFGETELNPFLSFPLSLVVGIVLFALGVLTWKLLKGYVGIVVKERKKFIIIRT